MKGKMTKSSPLVNCVFFFLLFHKYFIPLFKFDAVLQFHNLRIQFEHGENLICKTANISFPFVTISHKFCNDLQRQDVSQSFRCATELQFELLDRISNFHRRHFGDRIFPQTKATLYISCDTQCWIMTEPEIGFNWFIHEMVPNLKFNNLIVSNGIDCSQSIYYIKIWMFIMVELRFLLPL